MKDKFVEPKLFGGGILEFLTRYRENNTYIASVFYLTLGAVLFVVGIYNYDYQLWQYFVFPIIGVLFWTVTEYFLHRFLFHLESDNPKTQKMLYFMHIAHHDKPRDLTYVTASPIATLPIAIVIMLAVYLLIGKYSFLLLPGFILGYVVYEFIHHAVHKYQRVPKFLRPLWKHHLDHHFKCPDKKFGVSNTFWDKVFGT